MDRTDIMYIIIEEGESIWERYCQLKNSKNSIFDYRSIGTQRNLTKVTEKIINVHGLPVFII